MADKVTDEKILEAYHNSVIEVEAHEFDDEEIAKAVAEVEAAGMYEDDRSGE